MSHSQSPLGGYPQSPDPTLADPQWLQQLSTHPIFISKRSQNDQTSTSHIEAATQSEIHTRLMTIRGTDLIAIVDNEVRIASLVDAKASASNQPILPSSSSSTRLGSHFAYKVLVPPQGTSIDFDIRNLSINPTGKLLACVGDSQITLLVLPRTGYTKHVDREIACRTVSVAPYYHSAHSNSAVVKVDWHPWGENGTSLLVLTDDGLFREYDVAKDTEEPQQTASFLPRQSSSAGHRSRSRSATPGLAPHTRSSSFAANTTGPSVRGFGLSADDDDATTAVSFSLCVTNTPSPRSSSFDQDADRTWAAEAQRSSGPSDWSPLTVFGLMKNGDVWALCPFLPKSATVPAAYIHNLAKLASYRANTTQSQQTSHVDTQLRYVNALLKQARKESPNDFGERQGSVTPGPERFVRSRSTSTMNLDELTDSPRASVQPEQAGSGAEQMQEGPVQLHPPSWSYRQNLAQGGSAKKAPRPQGPYLLKPAPVELCDERESVACDLIWTWLTDESTQAEASTVVTGVAALSIVGHDGRVDVGLLFESVEAAWDVSTTTQHSAARRPSKPRKTNRYGLSDTEDEADDFEALTLEEPEELPSLLVYETIDLGLLDTAIDNGITSPSAASDLLLSKASSNRPRFVRDPLYGDTVYIYHAFGAQCLGFATWIPKLLDALNKPSQDELDNDAHDDTSRPAAESREQALVKMLHHGQSSEVVWIVNTVAQDSGEGLDLNPVTALEILSDVYLSYAFLAVTADLQVVGVELSLRIEQDAIDSPAAGERSLGLERGGSSDGHKPYVSLLGEGPAFQPPAIFAQSTGTQGLPSHPRRAALSTPNSKSELQITPELLRTLGKTVETYRHEIRTVVSAGNAVQARLDLQVREMTRQLEKLNAIRLRCNDLGTAGTLGERISQIAQTQLQLVARIDKALQRLMDSHQPSLSMYEKKWFEELERIASEVGVARSGGEFKVNTRGMRKSLSAKAKLLEHQLSLLRPQMSALQSQAGAGREEREGMLGGEQLKRVEKMLSGEAAMLAEAKEKVNQLNRKVAQIKPNRDTGTVGGGGFDADSSISFSTVSGGFGGGGAGLPTSSTAANLADFSRSSPFRASHSRTGSSFFA
ncbi:nuclear pore complex protein [Pseudozyma hubeiensis SY62]|uniref:Nuclear pore complex protein n=1 Tax=Pseudozyma hubeiensis (strain SY62) TaxID=1305764 RepID=R9PBU9_PSEHS|nr:nuclear pore complex protein [Pseudozyma hubeiensis SY62]GAC95565.1 nuclear pore complex protein [Pseudozyma hubeiensis SY62]